MTWWTQVASLSWEKPTFHEHSHTIHRSPFPIQVTKAPPRIAAHHHRPSPTPGGQMRRRWLGPRYKPPLVPGAPVETAPPEDHTRCLTSAWSTKGGLGEMWHSLLLEPRQSRSTHSSHTIHRRPFPTQVTKARHTRPILPQTTPEHRPHPPIVAQFAPTAGAVKAAMRDLGPL